MVHECKYPSWAQLTFQKLHSFENGLPEMWLGLPLSVMLTLCYHANITLTCICNLGPIFADA